MPTLKEKLAIAKAEKANQPKKATLKEQLVSSKKPEVEEDYDRNWYDAPRAALQGMTMGFSDELGALAGAGIAKGAQFFNDDETDFGDIYDQMKSRINQERGAYEEAHPAEALALNFGGGMLTGGIGGSKVLGAKAMQNAGTLKKTLALTALGATEGGIAGAGSAKEGERLQGAGRGATIGAVLPLAMGGGRSIMDVVSNRRVQRELADTAGNFLPINQAADEGSIIGNIYQKIIGPSFGGQKLRNQNRSVLNRATRAFDESKAAKETAKTTGKQDLESILRGTGKERSLPSNVSEEFKTKILQSDGHEAIENINKAWSNGFEMVKNKNFKVNPKDLVKEVMDDLDTPMDSEFAGRIGGMIKQKIGKGFTADTATPDVKYLTKGMGSQKAPNVELDEGMVDGQWLMQARNKLRMAANDLSDEGASALEIRALKSSAKKIDDLIRKNLDENDLAAFDQELTNWGNYQAVKKATRKAGTTKQGKYEPQELLQASRTNQPRKFDEGKAPFQTEAQALQVKQDGIIDRASKQIEFDESALKEVKDKLPNLNPDPWTKSVSTATIGAPLLAPLPIDNITKAASTIPLGFGVGKLASTETGQRMVAGQTQLQKTLAKLLRQYEGSNAQKALQSGQGAFSRSAIMNPTGE